MIAGFDFDVIWRSLPYVLLEGLRFTLLLTALATVGGIALGTVLAMMRLSGNAVLSGVAVAYTTLFRSVPLVLVIFWFYFLMPYVLQWAYGAPRPIPLGAFYAALIPFILFEAAYFAEIMRAGIQSVPRGQVNAGYALGLGYGQVMGAIVLPQAFRAMVPVLLTQTIVLFQDTSLVYVISLTDLLGAATTIARRDGRLVEMYIFAALVYFVISFALSRVVKHLQAKYAIVK